MEHASATQVISRCCPRERLLSEGSSSVGRGSRLTAPLSPGEAWEGLSSRHGSVESQGQPDGTLQVQEDRESDGHREGVCVCLFHEKRALGSVTVGPNNPGPCS